MGQKKEKKNWTLLNLLIGEDGEEVGAATVDGAADGVADGEATEVFHSIDLM